jgi:hypothetical protein
MESQAKKGQGRGAIRPWPAVGCPATASEVAPEVPHTAARCARVICGWGPPVPGAATLQHVEPVAVVLHIRLPNKHREPLLVETRPRGSQHLAGLLGRCRFAGCGLRG